MNRSMFLRASLRAASALALAGAAGFPLQALAANPAEGKDFLTVKPPQPVDGQGKIVVTEFFWYGCPHCFELEPSIVAWGKKQSKDVSFQLVPVSFNDTTLPHSQIYYALETLGKLEELHDKVFNAIHVQRKRLLKEDEIADWMASQGVDHAKFLAAFKSFSANSKSRGANKMADDYRLDGVPAIAVNGKYLTSPSIAGSSERVLQTLDFLIAQERGAKKK
ncbi:MAG: thiol:disulfide interchange protein DsbA/DsbL [Candidatus Protistobacter heckmanni]|nr:thiol:disulfide interchange protein DsbA/DsbL [Candidatus Protistobacter heckmanni]